MRFISRQIVFREIPDEISLSYLIAGCRKRCPGCHSSDSWNPMAGKELTREQLETDVRRYRGRITCVLFMGGEWHEKQLVLFLRLARSRGLKTGLYTGDDMVAKELSAHLDYLKTGSYQRRLGGLDSPETNQRLVHLPTGRVLNSYFINNWSKQHDQTQPQSIDRKTEVS